MPIPNSAIAMKYIDYDDISIVALFVEKVDDDSRYAYQYKIATRYIAGRIMETAKSLNLLMRYDEPKSPARLGSARRPGAWARSSCAYMT